MLGYAKLASSSLSFTKKYWKELLIFFCVLALFAKMRGDYSSLVATFESATESHQEQMDKVKEIHQQELIARDELIKRYSERLVDLELKHADDKEALLEEYAKRKKAYVIAFGENGEGLKKDIEDYLGLEYVKP
tara:strand:+ start:94 stop:495 length:402 start_codon:yes stop_codon:yes gene_type:complete